METAGHLQAGYMRSFGSSVRGLSPGSFDHTHVPWKFHGILYMQWDSVYFLGKVYSGYKIEYDVSILLSTLLVK